MLSSDLKILHPNNGVRSYSQFDEAVHSAVTLHDMNFFSINFKDIA